MNPFKKLSFRVQIIAFITGVFCICSLIGGVFIFKKTDASITQTFRAKQTYRARSLLTNTGINPVVIPSFKPKEHASIKYRYFGKTRSLFQTDGFTRNNPDLFYVSVSRKDQRSSGTFLLTLAVAKQPLTKQLHRLKEYFLLTLVVTVVLAVFYLICFLSFCSNLFKTSFRPPKM